MHMFCSAWNIVPPCGCRLRSLSWVCWIVLFVVRKGCVRVSFVVYGRRFITEWTTQWMGIFIILLQPVVILELWWSRAVELINLVGRFYLLLCVCEICWGRACFVVAPWARLRALWTSAYWGLSLIFYLYSVSFCGSIFSLVSLFWNRSGL